ncbi:MAG: DNA polymerase III subunit alpha [Nitrospinae bacterium]|nr:DNA polymerase III subunit alpha [Nitrospinota bacterium]
MQHSDFVHLHLHTQYSLLDGALRFDPLFQRADKYKMPALAITDHGNMFGVIEFYQKAKTYGIKPIIGCEVYVAPGSRFERSGVEGISDASYHLTLMAKDNTGYKNLIKLVTIGYLEGFYYHPRIDKDILSKYSEGLIALGGCMKGEISQLLLKEDEEGAFKATTVFRDIMGNDRFYIEIQDQGLKEQEKINKGLIRLSQRLSIPLVATNDCHYLDKNDARAHEVLLCIQTGKTMNDPKRMRFSSDQFYLRSPEEMKHLFKDIPEAINNSIQISERCNIDLRFNQIFLPHYNVPDEDSLDSFMERLASEGLERRLKVKMVSEEEKGIYHKRLEEELEVIKKMRYSGYFLIVWDFIDYARKREIPVGPGRGSAAGSLVSYALRITDLDPIRYGLLFERFLNPERVSLPDIDIDFCMEKRDEVIAYVTKKYGKENVSQIITFGSMMAKGVVRDVGRVLDIPYSEVDRIAKLIPNRLNITLKEAIKEEPRLKEMMDKDEKIRFLLDTAITLEGLPRHASTHAAGVVISPRPLTEFLPLYRGAQGEIITQYPMKDIESLGLLKMDFLGLRTLTVIRNTIKMIKESRGIDILIEEIPLDDRRTYQLLSDGETMGVFQLESRGMRDLLKKMKPNVFEDIIALLALYRPGPLNSGMVDDFIKRRHGIVPVKYDLPQIEGILKETHGVILYQEQVMKIASDLAGFSMGMADILRRAMGKKKPEEMATQRERFIDGTAQNKISRNKAEKIFDLMEHFAGYGFNKSHSAAYALVAYQTAYLKAYYPLEFIASLLTSDMDNTNKVISYINECRDMGIKVLPPDVNESFKDFTVIGEAIRFGLAAIKNVGEGAIDAILKVRKRLNRFSSLNNLCENVDLRIVNRRVIENLIKCGAFDSIGQRRDYLMGILESTLEIAQRTQRDREMGQISLFSPSESAPNNIAHQGEEWSEKDLLRYEKEALGFYITGHPLVPFKKELKRLANVTTQEISEVKNGKKISIGGIITNVRPQITRKGDQMAYITLEDLQGSVEMILFPDEYKRYISFLESEDPLLIKGDTKIEDEEIRIIAKEIIPLGEISGRLSTSVHINLHTTGLKRDLLISLKDILEKNRGESNVYLHLMFPDRSEVSISADSKIRVNLSDSMITQIEGLIGNDTVYEEILNSKS